MQQTMLTILALFIFSLFAVSQHRRLANAERSMIRNTIAVMTNGVAVQTLDEAATFDFDNATTAGTVFSASDLTAKADFGAAGETLNDLDDWSKVDLHPDSTLSDVSRLVREGGNYHTLNFVRTAEVDYVEEVTVGGKKTWQENNLVPTKYKRITVTVYAQGIAFADTVRISQVIACGKYCQW